tara:strand:- start:37113 stop:37265 length:153 start_codon:yes stop_codon:yes gene_type:complete
MTYNIEKIITEQSWNETTVKILTKGFIQEKGLVADFENYLSETQKEENNF